MTLPIPGLVKCEGAMCDKCKYCFYVYSTCMWLPLSILVADRLKLDEKGSESDLAVWY